MAGTPMTRGINGVWTIDFSEIQPGVYRYTFSVDGVQTTDSRNPVSSESLNSVRSMYKVPGGAFLEYKPDVPHGAIASVWYSSKAVGGLRRMHIYTPPGHGIDNHRYPVLYLLHGGGDTDDSWPTVGRAGAILDNLIAEHKAVPMIVVMPMGRDAFNQDLVGREWIAIMTAVVWSAMKGRARSSVPSSMITLYASRIAARGGMRDHSPIVAKWRAMFIHFFTWM